MRSLLNIETTLLSVRDIASHYSIFPEDQSIDFILSYENESKLLVDINIIRNGVNMGCKNYIFLNQIMRI